MNDDEFNPFDDDELFDDEYADSMSENSDKDQSFLDSDTVLEESEESEESEEEYEEPNGDFEDTDSEDAITMYLRSHGINARSIKFEDEAGNIDEIDFNDLSAKEQLQILQDQTTKVDDSDLSDDEIQLLNSIRQNGWSVKDYNDYISKMAIDKYNQDNVNNYTVSSLADDELFLLDLEARYPDITNEEKVEELEHAKQNPSLYEKKIQSLRDDYLAREQQLNQKRAQEQKMHEQQQLQEFSNQIVNSIRKHRVMDIGLGTEQIELSDEDMQDIYNILLGTDQAGNRYITNILKNPDSLVEAVWYLSKGKRLGQDIQDYYKHQITQARQNGYKKGYDDAKAGRQNSSKAVVSKRQNFPKKKQEQTIYDLD